ncbi:MAG: RHS repeat-associated core domain-containing protein [Patescibacteria group bacterium]|jgi:RHS repeat-associated protein
MRKATLFFIIFSLTILPFANVLAFGTDNRFTGKPLDPSTNLYYYGQRYYDPNISQFTQPDPVLKYLNDTQKLRATTGKDLQQFLQNPQALNEYSYTLNNPVKYIDPTGETAIQVIMGKQPLSAYQIEIGQGAEVLYNEGGLGKSIMDHPVITGAVVGIGTGLAATGLGFLIQRGLIGLGLMAQPTISSGFNVAKEFDKLNQSAQGAYEIAKAGGKNFGLIDNAKKLGQTAEQLQKGINSLEARVLEHLNYIKDPSTYGNYNQFIKQPLEKQLQDKAFWYKEAIRYSNEANVFKGILNELTK